MAEKYVDRDGFVFADFEVEGAAQAV